MAEKYVIDGNTLTGIADAIREKTETTEEIPVVEMRPKILGITSGGMYASIFIVGLSETDTVTATLGDKTKTAVWNSEESRHEITKIGEQGMWTVTATNGKDTTTQDVLVDAAAEYEINMTYVVNYTMLYDAGDECEDVTGGWSTEGYKMTNSGIDYSVIAATKNKDNVVAENTGRRQWVMLGSDNAITFDKYSMLGCCFVANKGGAIYVNTSKSVVYGSGSSTARVDVLAENKTVAVSDISFVTKNCFVAVGRVTTNTTADNYAATFYSVFLTMPDDWQTLCSKAGLSAQTDLATLIADTASIAAILANESAVRHMVSDCTGDFMASFVASADCLSALQSSPYKSTILSNRHWAKFLAMVGVTA